MSSYPTGRFDGLRANAGEQVRRSLRWLASCFEADNLIAGLKTLSWLAPLTVLIWVYAEREQIVQPDNQPIPISVRSNDPNQYVALQMSDETPTATLSGPRSRLEQVRLEIAPHDGKPTVVLTIPDGLSTNSVHELDTAPLINASAIFALNGVTVKECKPVRLKVFVDAFEERELPVLPPADTSNLAGAPKFDVQTVRVRAPHSAFQKAGSALRIEADLAGSGMITEGPHEAIVNIIAPSLKGDGITITPAKTKATFEVRSSNKVGTIRSIAVNVSGPRVLMERYTVKCNDTLSNVEVVGPPDKIDALTRVDSPIKPWAVLQVSNEDRGAAAPSRLLTFEGLPEGVKVTGAEALKPFDFKLVEKTSD